MVCNRFITHDVHVSLNVPWFSNVLSHYHPHTSLYGVHNVSWERRFLRIDWTFMWPHLFGRDVFCSVHGILRQSTELRQCSSTWKAWKFVGLTSVHNYMYIVSLHVSVTHYCSCRHLWCAIAIGWNFGRWSCTRRTSWTSVTATSTASASAPAASVPRGDCGQCGSGKNI